MLSGSGIGRFIIWDKHVRVSAKQVGNDRAVGWRATLRNYRDGSPPAGDEDEGYKDQDGNAE